MTINSKSTVAALALLATMSGTALANDKPSFQKPADGSEKLVERCVAEFKKDAPKDIDANTPEMLEIIKKLCEAAIKAGAYPRPDGIK